jgi:transposase-like protein
MSSWTDETKAEVVAAYLAENPTPETSMEIVNKLAEEFEQTPNSVRMVLSQAEVYVKKTDSKKSASTSSTAKEGEAKPRKSKQSSIDELSEAITSSGFAVDEAIVSKLTGKAADYFTSIIKAAK